MTKRRPKSEVLEPDQFDALFHRGILKAQSGLSQEALQLFNEALKINPRSAEVNLNLGNVLAETARPEEALVSYDNALAIRPEFAEALYCRGNALQTLKRHEEALASYDRALAIVPGRAEILGNRGNPLHDLKRYEEALASYDEAIAIMPGAALLHNNRGNTLRELKRLEEALASLDRALAIEPDYVDAMNNRGNTLQALQRYEEALASFELALVSSPDNAVVHNNRGNTLQDLQRYEEALASYDKALAIRPDFAEALLGRGNVLRKLRRFEEAVACCEKALIIQPNYVEALNSRGNTLQELQRYEEALSSYREALAKSPDDAVVHNNRGNVLLDLKRYEEAVTSFENALAIKPDFEYAAGMLARVRMHCCDWRARDEEVGRLTVDIRAGKRSITPLVFLGVSDSAADQLRCSRIFATNNYPAASQPAWRGERYSHKRIRVAYLSADFRVHPSSFLLAGMFEHHDRSQFEAMALSFGHDDQSEIRTRLRAAFEHFIDVRNRSDLEVARLMRELEVDIAVDLMGHTRYGRMGILALRAAPVQVNYLGFPATMGADCFDYILADDFIIPREKQSCYSEHVVYLPDSFQANDDKRKMSEKIPARLEAGLPESGLVFCSFNKSYKISPAIFDVWTRLLKAVTGSVLWLVADNLTVENNLRREAANRGIEPRRLIFAPRLRYADHLARFQLADLFLDTLPFNAGATASDALWTGVPVLTCTGEAFASRMAGSLLKAIGLPELITYNLEDYEALAHKLATSPTMLNDIRARLAQNRHTHALFNTDRFRRHIEAAYTTMWQRSQRGEAPESFAVEPVDK